MTRTSCLATLSFAAVLLALTAYGCSDPVDTLSPGEGVGSGSGGSSGSGAGGLYGGNSGNQKGSGGQYGTIGGSGSHDAGVPGGPVGGGNMGGGNMGGGGGRRPDGGAFDARERPDARGRFDLRPRRDAEPADAQAEDGGSIPMCSEGARCVPGTRPVTCSEACMVRMEAGERTCECVRPGIVICGACRRAPDGGAMP